MRRYELTDEQWQQIQDLMPPNGHSGRQWREHRQVLNGIFWILHSGAQWRELPERYGPWKTVYNRFNLWRRQGLFDQILRRLQVRLDKDGRIDWDLWCVDGSSIRASRSAAGGGKKGEEEPADHALGCSRGGWGSKLHLVTDGQGVPLAAVLTAGQVHETQGLEPVMNAVRIGRRRRPGRLAGDKGYSSRTIRTWLKRHRVHPVIPLREDQKPGQSDPGFDRQAYRRRNVIERCVGWLKENRRLGTRFEKLAVNFLAMVKLAMIQRYFRIFDLRDRT
ncbi:MAG: IS5 family transposase [Phycisphaerae bacterium]|nr:IS5 family transposase [Phycisphaerae bacterium]